MNCRGTEELHTLAFGFAPPRRERQWMPIDDSECCRGHFAQEPQRDGYTVDTAADDGNRDVSMRKMLHVNLCSDPGDGHSSAQRSA